MLIYSRKIITFIKDIKARLKDILSREVRLKVFGDRFYDRRQEYSYPINIVIFNNKSMLGYFDSHFYELGFHECLMHSSKDQLNDIIRHEFAHYITFINYGNAIELHGTEFRAFCERMEWNRGVQKATICLDNEVCCPKKEESAVFRKVQKLMALAASSNENEAEQAMIKSQQLLLKHNINFKYIENEDEEKIFLKRIMRQKKKNAKMHTIAKILETFFVNTVYNRLEGFTYLEIVGSAINIEIAEYVANILEHELDKLWNQTKKQRFGLKGTIAKSSFFLGVAQGYCNKIHFLKRQYNNNTSNALIIIEKKLENAKAMVYPRLTTSNSHARYCSESSRLGERAGRQLNINPGISNSTKSSEFCLSFQLETL